MSKLTGWVGQGFCHEPTRDHPLGFSRVEVLGMPLPMFLEIEGHTGLRPGDEITITVEES